MRERRRLEKLLPILHPKKKSLLLSQKFGNHLIPALQKSPLQAQSSLQKAKRKRALRKKSPQPLQKPLSLKRDLLLLTRIRLIPLLSQVMRQRKKPEKLLPIPHLKKKKHLLSQKASNHLIPALQKSPLQAQSSLQKAKRKRALRKKSPQPLQKPLSLKRDLLLLTKIRLIPPLSQVMRQRKSLEKPLPIPHPKKKSHLLNQKASNHSIPALQKSPLQAQNPRQKTKRKRSLRKKSPQPFQRPQKLLERALVPNTPNHHPNQRCEAN
jgi:hypothetical protein